MNDSGGTVPKRLRLFMVVDILKVSAFIKAICVTREKRNIATTSILQHMRVRSISRTQICHNAMNNQMPWVGRYVTAEMIQTIARICTWSAYVRHRNHKAWGVKMVIKARTSGTMAPPSNLEVGHHQFGFLSV